MAEKMDGVRFVPWRRSRRVSGAALAIFVFVTVACGSATIRVRPTTEILTTVAQADVPGVRVFDEPGAKSPRLVLRNPDRSGARLVFVVRNMDRRWLEVELPVRPNGSLGWIARTDVQLSEHDFRIVVDLGAHTITVSRGTTVVDKEAVGVGRRDTPTPGGSYFTTALIRPPDPNGFYGPYVYVLSGFSEVLNQFGGSNGVIGIHGTSEPWGLGRDVSHGCIRMSNAGITRLAQLLPVGVPVDIRP